MSRVSVPVEVLLWVEVEDGTDEEVADRAYERLHEAIPGMDGTGTLDGRLFSSHLAEIVDYVTYADADVSLAVRRNEQGDLVER